MTDGYFLSTYLTPVGHARLLDLWLRHDSAVALWKKTGPRVELVHYWELERLTGEKEHGRAFWTVPELTSFLGRLLSTVGLQLSDITDVWGSPDLGHKLWSPVASAPLSAHATAHVYSALMIDTDILRRHPVLALAVDGGPDDALEQTAPKAWYAGAMHRPGQPVEWFPVQSPGMLYHIAREHYGRREGTLMALGSAHPIRVDMKPDELLAGTAFSGNTSENAAKDIVAAIHAEVVRVLPADLQADGFSRDELIASASMKVVESVARALMRREIESACARYEIDTADTYLALAGGFALNCPINTYLVDEFGFKGLLAPPTVNDSGQALGIGLWAFSDIGGGPEQVEFALGHAYHGGAAGGLQDLGELGSLVESVEPWSPEGLVRDLEQGPVVWVEGRAEIGPRALGHRSLLADPRDPRSKNRLNELKKRQWWRPVAPVVMEPYVRDWFHLDRSSPYMLEAPEATERTVRLAPAVCHLDGTARVQTISAGDAPLLYAAIDAFRRATGLPMLCNTSLNDAGEPIVNSVSEAVTFALRKQLRVCYLDGLRVTLAKATGSTMPVATRPYAADFDTVAPPGIEAELNPAGVPATTVYTWLKTSALRRRFDLTRVDEAERVHDYVEALLSRKPGARESVSLRIKRRRSQP